MLVNSEITRKSTEVYVTLERKPVHKIASLYVCRDIDMTIIIPCERTQIFNFNAAHGLLICETPVEKKLCR